MHVSVITKKLHAALASLDEGGTLPDETYDTILCCSTKCSNEEFKVVNKHLLA